jgi:hypothetical protein
MTVTSPLNADVEQIQKVKLYLISHYDYICFEDKPHGRCRLSCLHFYELINFSWLDVFACEGGFIRIFYLTQALGGVPIFYDYNKHNIRNYEGI